MICSTFVLSLAVDDDAILALPAPLVALPAGARCIRLACWPRVALPGADGQPGALRFRVVVLLLAAVRLERSLAGVTGRLMP